MIIPITRYTYGIEIRCNRDWASIAIEGFRGKSLYWRRYAYFVWPWSAMRELPPWGAHYFETSNFIPKDPTHV